MNDQKREIYIPPEGPPQGINLDPAIYELMGQDGIFQMLKNFYGELEKSEIRHHFPDDMDEASEKSAAFFVGLLGGPPLYHQKYGPPMMRKRHFKFIINEQGRKIWVQCFLNILDKEEKSFCFPQEHMGEFKKFLESFSKWMVNTQ